MQIIILGAGIVGAVLAEHLSSDERSAVTLIDKDPARLKDLQRRLDIKTVQGFVSWPSSLEEADIETADMLIAVTDSDEINLVACQIAFNLYQTPRRIARIRTEDYLQEPKLFEDEGFSVDVRISPEKLVTDHIAHLILYPGALQVISFLSGQLKLIAIKPFENGLILNQSVQAVQKLAEHVDWKIVCLLRNGSVIPAEKDTSIAIEDEVYFIAHADDINHILEALGRINCTNRQIIVAGGSHIGLCLSRKLEEFYQVKVIEPKSDRGQLLADELKKSIVLQGEVNDRTLLSDEHIEKCDVFCAATYSDEANIIACLQAKRLGARQVIAVINQKNYIDLVESRLIDVAVSPQEAAVSSILRYIRQGDIVQVHPLRHDAAEIIEIIAHGNSDTSSVVGKLVLDLALPKGVDVIAITRNKEIKIQLKDLTIVQDDHVILLVTDKKSIKDIERFFKVKVNFF